MTSFAGKGKVTGSNQDRRLFKAGENEFVKFGYFRLLRATEGPYRLASWLIGCGGHGAEDP